MEENIKALGRLVFIARSKKDSLLCASVIDNTILFRFWMDERAFELCVSVGEYFPMLLLCV